MPESPRWLLSVGQPEQARAVLAQYHANGRLDDELVEYEIDEINRSIALERKFENAGWALLWNTSANRKKMAVAMGSFMICLWLVLKITMPYKERNLLTKKQVWTRCNIVLLFANSYQCQDH